MKQPNILVIGDACIDHFLIGTVYGTSPEAPIPVLKVEREEYRLGMAANVANNIISMGSAVTLIYASGESKENTLIKSRLLNAGIRFECIDDGRQTTIKQRGVVGRTYISRNDYETTKPLQWEVLKHTLDSLDLEQYDGIIISDYGKGVIGFPKELISHIKTKTQTPIFVDPDKFKQHNDYQSVFCIKANEKESFALTNKKDVYEALEVLNYTCINPIITMGDKGGVYMYDENVESYEANKVEDADVVGAGDTFLASLVVNYCSNGLFHVAIDEANIAASNVAKKFGTSV